MRKIIILLSFILLSFTSTNKEFCEGWNTGYCEGWEYVQGRYSRCPRIPRCPRPKIFESQYYDGYNRGFELGKKHAREE
tara:strand:+ start:2795 stop:3031 length:237 start_codon:yes stop_codon:yes gene_type:complete